MPKVVWDIDGNTKPLEGKLKRIDKLSAKTGSKLENMGGKGGVGSKGTSGTGASATGGFLGGGKLAGGLALAGIAAGAGVAVAGLAKLGGKLQTTRIQFQTLLGSAEKGNKTLSELAEFANSTPFSNDEVNQAGKTLLAFDFQAEELSKRMRMLGDIAAGTGKPFKDVAEIFGRIRQNGRLQGEELNRLIDGGFNPLGIIAEKTGKSVSTLRKEMSKGLITFDMVDDAFKTATSEGGKYFQMTTKLAESFEGKLSTALGKGNFLLQKIGEKTLPLFSAGLDAVIAAIDWLDKSIQQLDISGLVDPFMELWELAQPLMDMFNGLFDGAGATLKQFNLLQAIVDNLTLSMRALTLPFRVGLKLFGLLSKAADDIKQSFAGISQVIDGIKTLNLDKIQSGLDNVRGGVATSFSGLTEGITDFATKEAEKFANTIVNFGRKRGADSESAIQDAAQSGLDSTLAAQNAALGSSATDANTTRKSVGGGDSISGGDDITDITITIGNLVETIVFDQTSGETDAELQDRMTRILVGAVNNAQRLAGG